MLSSTLLFKRPIPRVATKLLCVAFVSLGGCIVYTLWLNPEVAFFKGAAEKKLRWAEKMNSQAEHKTVIYGGSSCMFAIDAERLVREHHLPAVNAGLGAGMGPNVLTQFALSQTEAGDTLVVALEPDLLGGSVENPSLGIQFSMALGHPKWLDGLESGERFSRLSALMSVRPVGF